VCYIAEQVFLVRGPATYVMRVGRRVAQFTSSALAVAALHTVVQAVNVLHTST
jgi:hypothetical protein